MFILFILDVYAFCDGGTRVLCKQIFPPNGTDGTKSQLCLINCSGPFYLGENIIGGMSIACTDQNYFYCISGVTCSVPGPYSILIDYWYWKLVIINEIYNVVYIRVVCICWMSLWLLFDSLKFRFLLLWAAFTTASFYYRI